MYRYARTHQIKSNTISPRNNVNVIVRLKQSRLFNASCVAKQVIDGLTHGHFLLVLVRFYALMPSGSYVMTDF